MSVVRAVNFQTGLLLAAAGLMLQVAGVAYGDLRLNLIGAPPVAAGVALVLVPETGEGAL